MSTPIPHIPTPQKVAPSTGNLPINTKTVVIAVALICIVVGIAVYMKDDTPPAAATATCEEEKNNIKKLQTSLNKLKGGQPSTSNTLYTNISNTYKQKHPECVSITSNAGVMNCINSVESSVNGKGNGETDTGTNKCYIKGTEDTIKTFLSGYGIDNVKLQVVSGKGYEITDFEWSTSIIDNDNYVKVNIPNALILEGQWAQFKDKKPSISKNLTCEQSKYTIKYNDTTSVVIEDNLAEGFENYVPQPIKEVFDWIAGRPDINEKSKLSLLPGFEF